MRMRLSSVESEWKEAECASLVRIAQSVHNWRSARVSVRMSPPSAESDRKEAECASLARMSLKVATLSLWKRLLATFCDANTAGFGQVSGKTGAKVSGTACFPGRSFGAVSGNFGVWFRASFGHERGAEFRGLYVFQGLGKMSFGQVSGRGPTSPPLSPTSGQGALWTFPGTKYPTEAQEEVIFTIPASSAQLKNKD